MKKIQVKNPADLVVALIYLTDAMAFGDSVEDVEAHVPEDFGASVCMMHLENGKRLLVTIATLPESNKG